MSVERFRRLGLLLEVVTQSWTNSQEVIIKPYHSHSHQAAALGPGAATWPAHTAGRDEVGFGPRQPDPVDTAPLA